MDLRLFPGVETVFSMVRDAVSRHDPKAARPIGIVTNGPTEVQRAKLELLGVDRLVDFVLVSEEFGVAKPDPAIFREALRFAEVGPEEAIFVGDSVEFDMAGARAAGIPTVWVNRHQRPWTEPGPPPTCQIRTPRGSASTSRRRSIDLQPSLIGATSRVHACACYDAGEVLDSASGATPLVGLAQRVIGTPAGP